MTSITKLFINSLILICFFKIQPTTSTLGDLIGCTLLPSCIASDGFCQDNLLYDYYMTIGKLDCCCTGIYATPIQKSRQKKFEKMKSDEKKTYKEEKIKQYANQRIEDLKELSEALIIL